MNHCTPRSVDEIAHRRQEREIETTARRLELAQDQFDRRNHRFDHFHKIAGYGPDVARLVHADDRIASDAWRGLDQKIKDRRFADGVGPFYSVKKSRPIQKVNRRSTFTVRRNDLQPAIEYLRTISAVDYLPAIAGVNPLAGNRVRCPRPSHEDSNPSASFKHTLWFCHACGRGGDLISLAEEVSGIPARGQDFIELSRWIASRLMTQADQVQAKLEARAA